MEVAKSMTIRLTDEQAAQLEAVSQAEGIPVSEAIRAAISRDIAARRKDTAFQKRLRASIERNQRILKQLAER